MDEKLQEIIEKYPNIKTRTVVADFSKILTLQEYKNLADNYLRDIDIAMLFLNAGVLANGVWGPFVNAVDEDVQSVVNTNALHTIYMAKVLLG